MFVTRRVSSHAGGVWRHWGVQMTGDVLLAMDDSASAEASYCEVRPSAQDAPYGDFRH
jgi:predicted negative regulator of RcsB-dependent stress response